MATLPTVGGDIGAWGSVLNAYLLVSHDAGGFLKDILSGTGSPEGVVTGTVGQIFRRTDGGTGTTLYVKESGSGNTGWIAYNSSIMNANTPTANYTLALVDAGKAIEMNVATANTLTVPTNANVAFPAGTIIEVCQYGAGQTTIVPASGVTINAPNGLKLISQFSTASLRKRATNEWMLIGDTTP